jgi:hypothetical protein
VSFLLLVFLLEPAQQLPLLGLGVEAAADPAALVAATQGLAAEVLSCTADSQHVSGSASGHRGLLPNGDGWNETYRLAFVASSVCGETLRLVNW